MTDAFSRESTEPGLSSCCFFNKTSGMAATKQKNGALFFVGHIGLSYMICGVLREMKFPVAAIGSSI